MANLDILSKLDDVSHINNFAVKAYYGFKKMSSATYKIRRRRKQFDNTFLFRQLRNKFNTL